MFRNVIGLPEALSLGSFTNGLIAWLFGATGPLLIVLQAAAQGHLQETETTSWIFGIYVIPGCLTLLQALLFRQPIGFAFSIPGAVLVGQTLAHHSFSEVIGAYLITGAVIFILGITGVVDRLMRVLPIPVMMGMVSGVLLPFGVGLFQAVRTEPLVNGVPLLVFMVFHLTPRLAKKFPPILAAILATALTLVVARQVHFAGAPVSLAKPHFYLPAWNGGAISQLVLPLVLTVVAIQNAQGIAVLQSEGYQPPVNSMTRWSGIGSIINGLFGAHTACVAGPMTALLTGEESGDPDQKYSAAVVLGILSIVFGLFAPIAASIPHAVPQSTISMLGGIAMISVLTDALKMSFGGGFKKSALFSFLITVSGVSVLHIGSPFWGLVGGVCASYVLDRDDHATLAQRAPVDVSQ
ncbi:benzoate/H(+) symporter BenE family transporter [Alicyclobacillus hesperidum]|uniref:benzoate/H(+) symporter BenE family transporter n=1 Tax=Alicyclobacillus hesperidum TaxID=89784 RepID=UPI00030CBFBA|nr:benzoate/H(+) symporter BenE family transporter [Alicyclobacillus hesperidum]